MGHLGLQELLGGGLRADLVLDRHEVMSKNITIRRRSLYLMSPGFSGAIWLAVDGLHGERAASASACFGCSVAGGGELGHGRWSLQLLEFDRS